MAVILVGIPWFNAQTTIKENSFNWGLQVSSSEVIWGHHGSSEGDQKLDLPLNLILSHLSSCAIHLSSSA
jgi:hypothetical protein